MVQYNYEHFFIRFLSFPVISNAYSLISLTTTYSPPKVTRKVLKIEVKLAVDCSLHGLAHACLHLDSGHHALPINGGPNEAVKVLMASAYPVQIIRDTFCKWVMKKVHTEGYKIVLM